MKELINRINSFNWNYHFYSSTDKYMKARRELYSIKQEVSKLSDEDLLDLYISINDLAKAESFGKDIFNNLDEKGMFNQVEEEAQSSNTELMNRLSKVMTEAWTILKSGIAATISEALKIAWKEIKLLERLRSGVAYFSFKKIDGTIRNAIGTLREGNFNYEYKGTKATRSGIVSYYDIEKRAFRSFKVNNLISIAS